MGVATDKVGNMVINDLQKGEYALAYKGQTIGIDEELVQNSNLYPNPTENIFNIECMETYDQLIINNMFGQQIYKSNVYSPLLQMDASYWAKGMYLVTAYNANQKVFSKKLIVR